MLLYFIYYIYHIIVKVFRKILREEQDPSHPIMHLRTVKWGAENRYKKVKKNNFKNFKNAILGTRIS